jgi:DNA-binding beta-propeller fold protein YncE
MKQVYATPTLILYLLLALVLLSSGCAQENTILPADTTQPTEVINSVSPISPVVEPISPLPPPISESRSTLPAKLTGPLAEYTINNGMRADFVPLPFYRPLTWTGITWDGNDYIWIANNELKAIAGFNIQKVTSDRLVAFPLDLKEMPIVTGLTWDGSNFWVSDVANGMIYELDLATGKRLKGFSYDGTPNGLVWGDNELWVVSKDRLAIERVSLTGERLQSLAIQGTWPSGLAWDGKYFWYSDSNEGTISILNPITGKYRKLDEIKFMANSSTFNGLVWMNGYMWIATEGDERLHRFDVSQLDWEALDDTLK